MLVESIKTFLNDTGVAQFFVSGGWKSLVMIAVACVLCYLAIKKQFEPLLLLPIAIGMLLTNLLGSGVYNELFFAGGHIHWDLFGGAEITEELIVEFVNGLHLEINEETFVANSLPEIRAVLDQLSEVSNHPAAIINLYDAGVTSITPGLIDVLYLGVKLGIYPCLIFVGVGAMTDFGPLIANPKSLVLGAAAQVGIFATFAAASGILGFTGAEAASIGIIGGADGPTAIFVTTKLAPHILGPIAVAAYSYMALVPVIQPPIMRLLTTKKERQIVMKPLRQVTKVQKILFPVVVTILVHLIIPSATPLVGCLMFGNLLRECGVCERLSKTVQNELMNIVTVFLGISVGATATAATFLSWNTIKIIVLGVIAFGVATASGVLIAKLMNVFLPEGKKINPLIGSAGVSAVPMAARVSQKVGQEENPGNFLLMHAMGPNVAGVIGSAIAAGVLIAFFG
ncbi:MAG: sodium ion-translocating decarboxylase subunit beta [Clostridia bacterium]|nr:sodium ion-translocating decarboxylase subunit beta [Clostridia bacterium]